MIDPIASAAFAALVERRGGDVIVLVDETLRIVRAGAEAAELAERPGEQITGMSLIAAFGSATLDAVARQALTSGEVVTGEADLGHLGGRRFSVDAVPLAADGLVLSLHDVTALRRMERVRRDFVANIGHELRTPLTSIKLLSETLTSGAVDDPATTRDFATQIEREADHLAQLVDELLDLSMIESGQTRLAVEALDPEEAVAACVQRIGPVAERRDIMVRRLEPPAEGVRALADPSRLGQALINLTHNAVKYSHHGGEVRVGWEPIDGIVRLHRRRRRYRRPGLAPAPDLRALLQGRSLARTGARRGAARRERRARPGDRSAHRRSARWLRGNDLRGRVWGPPSGSRCRRRPPTQLPLAPHGPGSGASRWSAATSRPSESMLRAQVEPFGFGNDVSTG